MSREEERAKSPLVIEGYQVYCSQQIQSGSPKNEDSSYKMDLSVNVKSEPIDSEYDQAAIEQVSEPPPQRKSRSANASCNWGSKSQIRDVISKSRDSAPKLRNVVDSLLQKNEQLLAQNDAVAYKPNPRVPRTTQEGKKGADGGLLAETTFLVSQTSQARITKSKGKEQDVVAGRLLRPRSPTRKSSIPEKDQTHLNMAIMESKLLDKDSEKVFRVEKHDLVSAVSSKAMFSSQEGKIAANIDLTYYWCNFCRFSTTSKHALLNHIIEHRFNCKYCKYQSFSRADVIKHSAKAHEEFAGMTLSLKYCTLLSDYLQVNSQDSDETRKRKPDPDYDNVAAKFRRTEGEGNDNSNSSSGSHGDRIQNSEDYEFFDMEVEEIEENNDHNTVTEEPPEDPPLAPKLTPNNTKPRNTAIRSKPFNSLPADQNSSYQQYPNNQGQAMQILPNVMGNQASVQTVPTPGTNKRTGSKGRSTPKASPQQQTRSTPAKTTASTVSSSLYWSCGYCNFKSDTQWKIKHHSVSKHAGKPHRYVALILPAGATGLNQEDDNESSSSATERDQDGGEDYDEDSNSNQSSSSMNGKQTGRKSGNGTWKVKLG